MSLEKKTISGILWNGISSSSNMVIEFLIGILLARLLSPDDFGLIGMMTIFLSISQILINSGFSQALIRKSNCTESDYSTIFFTNLLVGILLTVTIFIFSPSIAKFYARPELIILLRFVSITLLISSITIVHRSQVIQKMNFKVITKTMIISSMISGMVALYLAIIGCGVWALVIKVILRDLLESIQLWLYNNWKPKFIFSMNSFRELFNFSSKLLISGLLGAISQNLYYLVIGKYFSATELGFFTRAEMFRSIPSENVSNTVTSVAYPALAKVKEDPIRMKVGLQKIFLPLSLVIFCFMFGMMAASKPIIVSLLGITWLPVVPMLQILCLVGLFVPLNSLNVNMLNIVGRSDLYLKTQLFLQLSRVPVVIVGIYYGINSLLYGMLISTIISYFVFAYVSQKFTNYTIKDQLIDLLPNISIASIMALILYNINNLFYSSFANLVFLILTGIVITILLSEFSENKSYLQIKSILLPLLKKI